MASASAPAVTREQLSRAPLGRLVVAGARGSPRGRREEDDALGALGDLLEVADHRRLVAARLGGERHGRPHPQLELAAELGDQALLVLGELRVALGKQDVAVSRCHSQQLHAPIIAYALCAPKELGQRRAAQASSLDSSRSSSRSIRRMTSLEISPPLRSSTTALR